MANGSGAALRAAAMLDTNGVVLVAGPQKRSARGREILHACQSVVQG